MDIELTERGKEIVVLALSLMAYSVLAFDLITLLLSLVLVGMISLDVLSLWRYSEKISRFPLRVVERRLAMVAGARKEIPIRGKVRRFESASTNISWARIIRKGRNLFLELNPRVKGDYSINGVILTLGDSLGIAKAKIHVELDLKVKVFPRAIPILLLALRKLAGGIGYYYGYTKLSRLAGRGIEYLSSREYMIGDDLRMIDWKASSRLVRIIVRESSKEASGGYLLIYDRRSHGAESSDDLASLFLTSLLNFLREGSSVTLLISNGSEFLRFKDLNPWSALEIGISEVLKDFREDVIDLFEVIEPTSMGEVLTFLSKIDGAEYLPSEMLAQSDIIRESLDPSYKAIYLVSSLLIDTVIPLEIARRLSGEKELIILTEGRPWLDASSLEEAYYMYSSYEKIANAFRRYQYVRVISGAKLA